MKYIKGITLSGIGKTCQVIGKGKKYKICCQEAAAAPPLRCGKYPLDEIIGTDHNLMYKIVQANILLQKC